MKKHRRKVDIHKNNKDLRGSAIAYIHGRWCGENFTNQIWRLQKSHKVTFTKPKPQIHPKNSLKNTKFKASPKEKYFKIMAVMLNFKIMLLMIPRVFNQTVWPNNLLDSFNQSHVFNVTG